MFPIFDRTEIVATPVLTRKGLAIAVCPRFVAKCMNHSKEIPNDFAQGVWDNMDVADTMPSNFLIMHKNLLPQQIGLGRNGIWLSLDRDTLPTIPLLRKNAHRVVTYSGHNEDHSPEDRLILMHAFFTWMQAAQTLLASK